MDEMMPAEGFEDEALISEMPELRRFKPVEETLLAEKDRLQNELGECQLELEQVQRRLEIQSNYGNALQYKVTMLERQLSMQSGQLRHQINVLSQGLADAQVHEQASIRHALEQARNFQNTSGERAAHAREREAYLKEHELLIQQIESQRREIQKWKNEAHGRGSDIVRKCLQASVDEAVREERKKDAWIMEHFRNEIERFNACEPARRDSNFDVVNGKESLLVMSLRAEIAMLKAGSMSSTDINVTRPW